MARLKGTCMTCGIMVANAKLISLPKSDKKLCIYCRKKELHLRNKAIPAIIKINGSESLERPVNAFRINKTNQNMLSHDEELYLKTVKYKHDTFIEGTSKCSKLINLKNKLMDCKRKIKNKKVIEQKKIIENKEINKKFLSGLK